MNYSAPPPPPHLHPCLAPRNTACPMCKRQRAKPLQSSLCPPLSTLNSVLTWTAPGLRYLARRRPTR